VANNADRQLVSSGAPWEAIVGYSRAVRVGDTVHVAGTTAVGDDGAVLFPGDAAGQTRVILSKIVAALEQAGASPRDVVRTRIYTTDISRWEEIGRVHGEFFREVRPAATMVEVSRLIDPAMLVEIEAEAIIGSGSCRLGEPTYPGHSPGM
jgi:enamine deaminase RidA (YjgF/YER057c/UK114 family)